MELEHVSALCSCWWRAANLEVPGVGSGASGRTSGLEKLIQDQNVSGLTGRLDHGSFLPGGRWRCGDLVMMTLLHCFQGHTVTTFASFRVAVTTPADARLGEYTINNQRQTVFCQTGGTKKRQHLNNLADFCPELRPLHTHIM